MCSLHKGLPCLALELLNSPRKNHVASVLDRKRKTREKKLCLKRKKKRSERGRKLPMLGQRLTGEISWTTAMFVSL